MRRRILKYLLVGLLVLAFAGYFAFSTFFFSPAESDYEFDISTLIPREVDFFVAKAKLKDEFSAFPELAIAPRLAKTSAGDTFLTSPEWESFRAENIDPGLAELDATLASLPISVDLLEVFGGEDVAVAGYQRGTGAGQAGWAVYGRGNWMAKLGLALLRYPDLIGLADQGLNASTEDEITTLSGGQLSEPMYLTRVFDVLVAGVDRQLVEAARSLEISAGRDSFGQSARYNDYIARGERRGDEIELFVDYQKLAATQELPGRWPDTQSEDFFPAFMGRLFQASSVKEFIGTARFEDGIALDLHGDFSSELLTQAQKSLYRSKGLDRQQFKDRIAMFAPRDTGLLLYLQADLGDMLRQATNAFSPATLSLLEEPIRNVWGKGTAEEFIDELASAFHDRAILIMRPNDYPPDPTGPPHDDQPVPAWTIILWVKSEKKIDDLQNKVVAKQSFFGFSGREPGSNGVFNNKLDGGFRAQEYWTQAIPGTGHIATGRADDFFLLSNHFGMVQQILKTRFEGGERFPRLTDHPEFSDLLFESLPSAALTLWANPRSMGDALRKIMRRTAELSVAYDPRLVRQQKEAEVLKQQFSGRRENALDEAEKATLQALVDQRMREFDVEFRSTQVPELYRAYERNITYAEAVDGALLQLALQPKFFDLSLRVRSLLRPPSSL